MLRMMSVENEIDTGGAIQNVDFLELDKKTPPFYFAFGKRGHNAAVRLSEKREMSFKRKMQLVTHSKPDHEKRLGDFLRILRCSGYNKLSETCGLSISELEEMAARQARQLETQEQLLAAKAQRLRYLKSGGEAERLMRLREKVATQEERLRKLRALRGKVQSNKHGNTLLSSDLESLRAVFNEKEKELSVAVAKVDELTRQLEDLRRGGSKDTNGIGNGMLSNHAARNSQSTASVELDKLRRELLYRQKLREAQATKVADQRTKLTHRQEESNRVDRRIAELQERLHRKRFLNHQLAVTLKHQENVEDFLEKGVPTKNDSKYQTLPYNAKFTPFSVKHHQNYEDAQHEHVQDQAKFDKAIQQMQIITLDHHLEQPTRNSQLPVGNHKFNFGTNYHLHHQILHHNHQNTKSANCVIDAVAEPQLSNGTGHVPKSISAITGIREEDTSGCPRPYNYIPTGAIHSPDGNGIFSQSGTTRDVTSCSGSNGSISGSSSDGLGPTDSKNPRPALPPKPSKPTLPMRNTQSEVFPYGQRRILSTGDGNMMIPDRTELPIKAMPLFVKKSTTTSSSGNEASPTTSVPPLLSSTTTIHKITSSSTGNTGPLNGKTNNAMVRMSINRRIEMPPAFLFPESDPPPSDLVPEQYSSSTTSSLSSSASITSLPTTNLESRNNGENNDTVDATPLPSHSNQKGISPGIEEYTLPDLFPLSSPSSTENVFTKRIITLHSNRLSPNNNSTHQFPSTTLSSHHSILHDNNYSNNNTNYSNNNNYHDSSPTDSTNENNYENGQDNQQEAAIKSLSFPAVSDQEFSLKSKQLESPDTVIQDESQGRAEQNFIYDKENHENGNIGACESGNENNGNLETNNEFQHIPSIIKRIKKGNLKSSNKESSPSGRRVSFDPLALLLDASLEGELELVMKTAREVGNPSAANDEGITALHNSICAGHADVVRFLVEFGCDVNAQDSDGWTPLHCAASCNNVGMVKFLVEHGACIFATTLSDHETAAEKCEEDEDGFGPCTEYLYSIQEKLGITNNGVVYAVFDYEAQNPDELSFEAGKRLTVLRKGDEVEREWWWSISENETQGYIPRNLLGLYPRVMPEKRNAEC